MPSGNSRCDKNSITGRGARHEWMGNTIPTRLPATGGILPERKQKEMSKVSSPMAEANWLAIQREFPVPVK